MATRNVGYMSQFTGDKGEWVSYCYSGCADATTIIACLAGCIPTFLLCWVVNGLKL